MFYPGLSFSALALRGHRSRWDAAYAAPGGELPSLLLDFADATYGVAGVKVDNPLTLARIGRAPVDVAAPGLLIEPARTNLVPKSLAASANWSASGASLSNLNLNALGAFPGLSVVSNGANWHRASTPAVSYEANTDYTVTFWYGVGNSGSVKLTLYTNTGINLEAFGPPGALAKTAQTGGTTLSVINTDLGAGYYRCCVTFRLNTAASTGWGIGPGSAVAGDSVIALGAQVEANAVATGYIATTGSAVTRAADVVSLPTAGWAGAGAGSLVLTARSESSADVAFAEFGDGGGNKLALFRAASGAIAARVRNGTNTVTLASGITVARGADARIALGWDASGLALSVNGSASVFGAAPGMLSPVTLDFHAAGIGETSGPALTRILRHYKMRLPNAALEAISA